IKGVRADVIIFMTVDPVKHHILTVSFPRDSYVLSHSYGYRDKVNAFVQLGMDELMASIGDVVDTDISYFCQESFLTYVDMINDLGGVWIHVPMDVYMDQDSNRNVAEPYQMEEGYKKVYGEWALALARNRKYNGIYGGDFGRNRNQVLVVNEIIKRVTDTPELLDMIGLEWLYKLLVFTNFSDDDVKTLIQLGKDFAETGYTVDNYFIKCYDDSTEGGAYIARMYNYSINIARSKVKLVLTGEVDPDDPNLEDVLVGYTSGGAGTWNVGYIGETYDLRDVYDLDIDVDLDLENTTYDVEIQ
ncbi:MAG: LCP family protein, partial [Erysipelotrichaceae bacterium]|nr:LCP family protein [Erysipelotrichaceae bacterium]